MKLKPTHLITGAVAAALFLAIVADPSATITEATTERVVIEATGLGYSDLWLNHAPLSCNPLEGTRVLSSTSFSKGTFYWDAVGLEAPEVGDQACAHYMEEMSAMVTGGFRIYLPMVLSSKGS